MFIDPLDRDIYERGVLARRYPKVHKALIEEEREQRRKASEKPDALDRLIGRIKKFFRRNQ